MYRSTAQNRTQSELVSILQRRPDAVAMLCGSGAYPDLHGRVCFYQTEGGVIVAADVRGLPTGAEGCESEVFGFHIHGGEHCSGTREEPFADAGEHYNPEDCPHPAHGGDLPPLFGNRGRALSVVLTNRFTVGKILGKTVIVHAKPDDFHTQPGGDSGARIACGEIRR